MKVLLFWSGGKDSAWAFYQLRKAGLPVAALVTTATSDHIVPFHGVHVDWVRKQARALDLPLWEVPLPYPCPNDLYESIVGTLLTQARQQGFTHVAFGDLYLEDIRAYREKLVQGAGLQPLFPAWIGKARRSLGLARLMLSRGFRAIVTYTDPLQLPTPSPGTLYTWEWIKALPPTVDPCGERGEFHTFCFAGPIFEKPICLPKNALADLALPYCRRPLL